MHSFALILSIGTGVGLLWVVWRSPESHRSDVVNAGISTLVGALMGGRVIFVLVQWPYFQTHSVEIIQLWSGGFSWIGAILGAALSLVIFALVTHQNPAALADELIPLAGMIVVSVWLGCWLSGCAYGGEWSSFLAVPARDEWGRTTSRVPVQLLGALIGLIWMWALESFGKTHALKNGRTAAVATLTLGIQLTGLFFLRADPSALFLGLRGDIWAALALIVLALAWLISSAVNREDE